MAELVSVEVHVPIGKGETDRLSPKTTTAMTTLRPSLKKVDNAAAAVANADGVKKAKSHNYGAGPNRKSVDIEFTDIIYTVSEGRRKGRRDH